jgi:hypothetical protein
MTDYRLEVKGINESIRAFKKVDSDIPAGFRKEMLAIASDVAGEAQQRVPWKSGKAARSIKPRASQRGAGIAFGGSAAPYFPWLDFGGTTGKGHRPGQRFSGSVSREWLGNPRGEGRYVYPAIRDKSDDIEKAAEAAVINAAKRAQFEVK